MDFFKKLFGKKNKALTSNAPEVPDANSNEPSQESPQESLEGEATSNADQDMPMGAVMDSTDPNNPSI